MNNDNWDSYFYPGTEVLKNKLNIYEQKRLHKEEAQIVQYKSRLLDSVMKMSHQDCFDVNRLKSIHHFLFCDVYEWAGEFRNINFRKSEEVLNGESIEYASYFQIGNNLDKILGYFNSSAWDSPLIDKQTKLMGLGQLLCDLWQIHMFREGNTRTCVAFCLQFADKVGLNLDKEYFREHSAYLRDSIVLYSYGIQENLQSFLRQAYIEKTSSIESLNKQFMKSIRLVDLSDSVDQWIEQQDDKQFQNWLNINKRDVIHYIIQANVKSQNDINNVLENIKEGMTESNEIEEDYELE